MDIKLAFYFGKGIFELVNRTLYMR